MVYTGATLALTKRSRAKSVRVKHVRRSVTLPPKIAKQVETLARERDLSDNRVLVELIEQGIEARKQKEKAFFQLAERFRSADDPEQVKQLGNQLGRFVFGEGCRAGDTADRANAKGGFAAALQTHPKQSA